MTPRETPRAAKPLRCVIYIRYSSNRQDGGYSLEYQTEECEKHARQRGYTVLNHYIDKAKTGRKTAGRDAYDSMMQDAADGKFDIIIVFSFSRAFRNTRDALNCNHELYKNHGIYIESVMEPLDMTNPHGKFSSTTLFAMHELQSEIIASHVSAAMYQAARHGYYLGGNVPLGYELYSTGEFAKGKERKRFRINETEAAYVREAFRMYADGATSHQILRMLQNAGIHGRQGAVMSLMGLYRILRREMYIGIVECHIKGHEPLRTHYPELQIIDNETWNKVQAKYNKPSSPKPRRQNTLYSLTGKLYGGKCGHHIVGTSAKSRGMHKHLYYYLCSCKKRTLNCDMKNIRKDELDNFVLESIKKYVLTEQMIDTIAQHIMLQIENSPTDLETQIKKLEKRKNDLIRYESDLVIKQLVGSISEETFAVLSQKFRNELEQIKAELLQAQSIAADEITVDFIKNYLTNMLLQIDSEDPEILFGIFEKLVESIIIYDNKVVLKLTVCPVLDKHSLGNPRYSLSNTYIRGKHRMPKNTIDK